MTTLNTIIEEEKKRFDRHFLGTEPDGEWEPNEIKNGTWTLFAYAAKNYLTTAMQRAYEAAKVERDTYWKEQLQKAREREAYIWFDSWYAYYIKESLVGGDDFGTWASKRLQTLGADHSELDQDKK